jgi:nitrite reductase/ring-hydroxylating ferredoxin subunit
VAKIQKIFILCLYALCSAACGKEETGPILPDVPRIYVGFNLNSPPYTQLRDIIPNAIKIEQGRQGYALNGLILVRLSDNAFRAYDATCTNDYHLKGSSLNVSQDGQTGTCPNCKKVYYLQTGAFDSEGKFRLQEYRVNYFAASGSGVIIN